MGYNPKNGIIVPVPKQGECVVWKDNREYIFTETDDAVLFGSVVSATVYYSL